ncbi:MAG: hypothetical protein ACRDRT_17835, partial [Pseudonocardiaceae bacterium]
MLYLALPLAFAVSSCCVTSGDLLDQGYKQMYDLQFGAAHRDFARFEQAHPENPMGPASDAAAYLFTEFDRLKILRSDFLSNNKAMFHGKRVTPNPKAAKSLDADLEESKKLAEASL